MKAKKYSKLRGKMRELGFTQAELAEAIQKNKSTLSLKLSGQQAFTNDETLAICDVLKIPTSEISDYFFANQVQKTEQAED